MSVQRFRIGAIIMTKNQDQHPETFTAQALGWIDETTGALVAPMHASTTYQRDPDNTYPSGYSYTRSGNPTYAQLEALLVELEQGAAAMVLGAGMSAVALPFMTLRPGDHVLVQDVLYWGVRQWLNRFVDQYGIKLEYFSIDQENSIAKLLRPGETRMVWVETPSNPTWQIVDIAKAAEAAHAAGARLCVDSTAATPVLTRPLTLGADLVMHAGTKYLNGHSDVLAGVLVTAKQDEWWAEMVATRRDIGTVLGPMEAWLLLRGIRTLHIRVARSCESAMAIARHFDGHPKIGQVLYPGLASHPGHTTARAQMQGGFGGMLSLRLAGGEASAFQLVNGAKLFKRATSFGGVESLIEHRASIEGEGSPVPGDLLRLSIGIEHPGDLIADLEQALEPVFA